MIVPRHTAVVDSAVARCPFTRATKVQGEAILVKNLPVITLIDTARGQPHRPLVPIRVGGGALEGVADRDDLQPLTTRRGHRESKLRLESCRVKARPASSRSKTASSVLKSTL